MKRRKREAFTLTGQPDVFDLERRGQKLSELGDPLEQLNQAIDWEQFRAILTKSPHVARKSNAGRKPLDAVLMFKLVILQRLYQLSDDQAEYQVRDRLSFQRFLGIEWQYGAPDAKTLWAFKEQLRRHGQLEALWVRFEAHLAERGWAAQGGQIVDAVMVEVPRQRNGREENAAIKAGAVPEDWPAQPKKLAQKDVEARWTKKRGQTYYGYKDHVPVDQAHKLIRAYTVTDAAVHDSQALDAVLDREATDRPVYADAAYRSEEREADLQQAGMDSQICERPYRDRPLTEAQKQRNREKSQVRVRVEHVFGFMTMNRGGSYLRCIGLARAKLTIGLMNLTYNLARFAYLVRAAAKNAAADRRRRAAPAFS